MAGAIQDFEDPSDAQADLNPAGQNALAGAANAEQAKEDTGGGAIPEPDSAPAPGATTSAGEDTAAPPAGGQGAIPEAEGGGSEGGARPEPGSDDWRNEVGKAVQGSLEAGKREMGADKAGVATPDRGSNIMAYLSGAGAMPPQQRDAAEAAVDPNKQMPDHERFMKALEAAAQQGQKAVFGLLQNARQMVNKYSGFGLHALDQGNDQAAAQAATEALSNVPSKFTFVVKALTGAAGDPEAMKALKERSFGGVRSDMRAAAGEMADVGTAAKAAGQNIADVGSGKNAQAAPAAPAPNTPAIPDEEAAPASPQTAATPAPAAPDASATAPAAPAPQGGADVQDVAPPKGSNVGVYPSNSPGKFVVQTRDPATGKVTKEQEVSRDQLKAMFKTNFDDHVIKGPDAALKVTQGALGPYKAGETVAQHVKANSADKPPGFDRATQDQATMAAKKTLRGYEDSPDYNKRLAEETQKVLHNPDRYDAQGNEKKWEKTGGFTPQEQKTKSAIDVAKARREGVGATAREQIASREKLATQNREGVTQRSNDTHAHALALAAAKAAVANNPELKLQDEYEKALTRAQGKASMAPAAAPAAGGTKKQAYFKDGKWFDAATHQPVQ